MGSNNRRGEREAAVKGFNVLAAELGEDIIKARPSPEDVVSLYMRLGASLPSERRNELKGWRDQWQQNGGDGDFPELPDGEDEENATAGSDQILPEHSQVVAIAKKKGSVCKARLSY